MKVATLGYIKKDGKTLMVHRNKKDNDIMKGKWNGMGGKVDSDETFLDCLKRELKEETGLEVLAANLVGFVIYTNNLGTGSNWIVALYNITEFTGELTDNSPEGDLEWIEDYRLLELDLNKSDYEFLVWMKEGKQFISVFEDETQEMNFNVEFYNEDFDEIFNDLRIDPSTITAEFEELVVQRLITLDELRSGLETRNDEINEFSNVS